MVECIKCYKIIFKNKYECHISYCKSYVKKKTESSKILIDKEFKERKQCPICGNMFYIESEWNEHRQDCFARCDICKETFDEIVNRNRHMVLSHKLKRPQCNICGIAISSKTKLQEHNKTCLANCPFEECSSKFSEIHQRNKHVREKHSYFTCGITYLSSNNETKTCDAKYRVRKNMQEHRDKHIEDFDKCDSCYIYVVKCFMNKHICIKQLNPEKKSKEVTTKREYKHEIKSEIVEFRNDIVYMGNAERSDLIKRNSNGNPVKNREGKFLLRKDLFWAIPYYGSTSISGQNCNGNSASRKVPEIPYNDSQLRLLGTSGLVKISGVLNVQEYFFQRFSIKKYKEYRKSIEKDGNVKKLMRRRPSTFVNENLIENVEFKPIATNHERGHGIPHNLVTSEYDRKDFASKINLWPQNPSQNNGKWKSKEMEIPKICEDDSFEFVDHSLCLIYRTDKNEVINECGYIEPVGYVRVAFFLRDNGNVGRIDCYYMQQYGEITDEVENLHLIDVEELFGLNLLFLNSENINRIDEDVRQKHQSSIKNLKQFD